MADAGEINTILLTVTFDWHGKHPSVSSTVDSAKLAANLAAQAKANIIAITQIQKKKFLPEMLEALPYHQGIIEEIGFDHLAIVWDKRSWSFDELGDIQASRRGKFVEIRLSHSKTGMNIACIATNQNLKNPSCFNALLLHLEHTWKSEDIDGIILFGALHPDSCKSSQSILHEMLMLNSTSQIEGDKPRLNSIFCSDIFGDMKVQIVENCKILRNPPVLAILGESSLSEPEGEEDVCLSEKTEMTEKTGNCDSNLAKMQEAKLQKGVNQTQQLPTHTLHPLSSNLKQPHDDNNEITDSNVVNSSAEEAHENTREEHITELESSMHEKPTPSMSSSEESVGKYDCQNSRKMPLEFNDLENIDENSLSKNRIDVDLQENSRGRVESETLVERDKYKYQSVLSYRKLLKRAKKHIAELRKVQEEAEGCDGLSAEASMDHLKASRNLTYLNEIDNVESGFPTLDDEDTNCNVHDTLDFKPVSFKRFAGILQDLDTLQQDFDKFKIVCEKSESKAFTEDEQFVKDETDEHSEVSKKLELKSDVGEALFSQHEDVDIDTGLDDESSENVIENNVEMASETSYSPTELSSHLHSEFQKDIEESFKESEQLCLADNNKEPAMDRINNDNNVLDHYPEAVYGITSNEKSMKLSNNVVADAPLDGFRASSIQFSEKSLVCPNLSQDVLLVMEAILTSLEYFDQLKERKSDATENRVQQRECKLEDAKYKTRELPEVVQFALSTDDSEIGMTPNVSSNKNSQLEKVENLTFNKPLPGLSSFEKLSSSFNSEANITDCTQSNQKNLRSIKGSEKCLPKQDKGRKLRCFDKNESESEHPNIESSRGNSQECFYFAKEKFCASELGRPKNEMLDITKSENQRLHDQLSAVENGSPIEAKMVEQVTRVYDENPTYLHYDEFKGETLQITRDSSKVLRIIKRKTSTSNGSYPGSKAKRNSDVLDTREDIENGPINKSTETSQNHDVAEKTIIDAHLPNDVLDESQSNETDCPKIKLPNRATIKNTDRSRLKTEEEVGSLGLRKEKCFQPTEITEHVKTHLNRDMKRDLFPLKHNNILEATFTTDSSHSPKRLDKLQQLFQQVKEANDEEKSLFLVKRLHHLISAGYQTNVDNRRICERTLEEGFCSVLFEKLRSYLLNAEYQLASILFFDCLFTGYHESQVEHQLVELADCIAAAMQANFLDPRIQETGATVLKKIISFHAAVFDYTVEKGYITIVKSAIQEHPNDRRVQQAGCSFFEYLSHSPKYHETLIGVGIIKTLERCMEIHKYDNVTSLHSGRALLMVLTASVVTINSRSQERIGRSSLQLLQIHKFSKEIAKLVLQLLSCICRKKDKIRRRFMRCDAADLILNTMRRNKYCSAIQNLGCSALLALTERSEKHKKYLVKLRLNTENVLLIALKSHKKDPVLIGTCLQLIHRLLPYLSVEMQRDLLAEILSAIRVHKNDERVQELGLLLLVRDEISPEFRRNFHEAINSCIQES